MKNHGLVLSKNTFCFNKITVSRQDHMDGLTLDFQETKDLIIVQLEEMSTLEDQLPMLIINVVYMLESKFQELTLRSFQVNGNSKLDHA